MKNRFVVGILLSMMLISAGFGNQVQISQVTLNIAVAGGVASSYDASTGVLTWSAGASGMLIDDMGNAYVDDNINVSGQFSNVSDSSSGGWASATFDLDSVVMTFNSVDFTSLTGGGMGSATLTLTKYDATKYWEAETEADSDVLHGQALANVAAVFNLEGVWGSVYEFVWDGIGDPGVSLLDSMTSLPIGSAFQSYFSNYASDNNMLVLYADESVPEPATIAILALGGCLLRRRWI